jgi:hypothetical protein
MGRVLRMVAATALALAVGLPVVATGRIRSRKPSRMNCATHRCEFFGHTTQGNGFSLMTFAGRAYLRTFAWVTCADGTTWNVAAGPPPMGLHRNGFASTSGSGSHVSGHLTGDQRQVSGLFTWHIAGVTVVGTGEHHEDCTSPNVSFSGPLYRYGSRWLRHPPSSGGGSPGR